MTTTSKSLLAFAVVGAIAGLVAFFGFSPFGKTIIEQFGTTTQGGTTSTAHYYSVAVNLANPGSNATSSSILNSSPNDYYVSSIKAGCESVGTSQTAYTGTGLAALTLKVATSSTPAPATNGNTNTVGGATAITIGTSTSNFAVSSSTISAAGTPQPFVVWAAGSYMTFTTNATNTAMCTFGVEAFSS